MKKYILSIFFVLLFSFFNIRTVFALDYSNTSGSTWQTSRRNANLQAIGQGDDESLTTFDIWVMNDSGGNVGFNTNSIGFFKMGSNYKSSYPAPRFTPDSIDCDPSDRCTGTEITSDPSEPVKVTANFSSAVLSSSYYYVVGYFANNTNNKLKVLGSTDNLVSEGSCYYEDTFNYTRVDDYGDHDWTYINKCDGLEDLNYSVNGATDIPQPTGSMDDEDIDANYEEITIDGSGDFDVTGEGYHATINLFQHCSDTAGDFDFQDHSVAVIDWYADDSATSTTKIDEFRYIGSGYTDTDSTYEFDGVTVPYTYGLNCSYPGYVRVFDADGDLVYNDITDNDNTPSVEFIPSTNTSTVSQPTLETENDGLLSGFFSQFKKYFNYLFSFAPVQYSFQRDFDELKDLAETKAPFGYVLSAFDVDVTEPTGTDDEVDNIVLAFSDISYFTSDYTIDPSTTIDGILNTVRTFISVALWFLFFGYVVTLTRRIQS